MAREEPRRVRWHSVLPIAGALQMRRTRRPAASWQAGLSAPGLLLMTCLCLALSPALPAEPIPPQPSHFESHMRSVLQSQLSPHDDLHDAIHRAALEEQRKAEAVAAAGTGTSEYLAWRLREGEGEGRRLEVEEGSSGNKGIQSPGLNTAPTMADINVTIVRYDSVNYPAVVDWRASPRLDTGIFDQKGCESCWLWVVTDTVAMAWSLFKGLEAPVPLSPQHICDCAFPKCCSGGWPEWSLAFAKLNKGVAPLASYPYLGQDRQTCQQPNKTSLAGEISGWEKVPGLSREALLKTVAQHPVVVLLYASGSFLRYTTGIFLGTDCTSRKSVNHALVVMGYSLAGAESYWIAKNSWGTGWGEGGYIRISMAGTVCGFGSEPSIYPTLFHVATPCDAVPSPCGAGKCYLMDDGATARCECPPGFVERLEDSAPKCVSTTPCAARINPCAFGTCTNEFDGSYSCTCPVGTVIGSDAAGAETCIVNSFQSGLETYTTLPGDDCEALVTFFSLSLSLLMTMNPFLNCDAPLTSGTVVVVQGAENGVGCGSSDAVMPGDDCASVAKRNGITVSQLQAINKAVVCPESDGVGNLRLSQHVCVLPGQLAVSSPFERSCGQAVQVNDGDTCMDASTNYHVSLAVLEWLNPGIDCARALPLTSICTSPLLLALTAVTCTQYYNLTHGDTCFTVASGAGLDLNAFLAINPGLPCSRLTVGRTVCIGGSAVPFASVETEPNVLPYYVRANDTLDSVSAFYIGQCDNAGEPGNATALQQFVKDICWANSWTWDCSDRQVVAGSMMLVPCVKNIGATSCDAKMALDTTIQWVCGNNGITYATYSCASAQRATPPIKYGACGSCDQYCISISGVSIRAWWGVLPSGCADRVCSYPSMPQATTASQVCTKGDACQLHQLQCSAATSSLSVVATPVSASIGCKTFKSCTTNNAVCTTFSKSPCGLSYEMSVCGF